MTYRKASEFQVIINGNLIPSSFEIDLEEEKNLKSAIITCHFLNNYADYHSIDINDRVVVKDKVNNVNVFEGYITDLQASKDGKVVNFEFTAFSDWAKSRHIIVNNFWNNVTLSEVFRQLINTNELKTGVSLGEVDETTYVMAQYEIEDETLFDAIIKLAELINFNVYVDENRKIHFKRYELTRNYYGLRSGNYQKGSANFTKTSSSLVNKLVVYGAEGLRVEITDLESRDKYGHKEDTLKLFDITSEADLEEYGKKHVDAFKEPLKTGSIVVFDKKTWKAGELIEVEIPELNLNNELLRITKIHSSFQEGFVRYTLSFNSQPRIGATIGTMMRKLRDLEKKSETGVMDAGSPQDINAVYQVLYHNQLISSPEPVDFSYNPAFDRPANYEDLGHMGSGSSTDPWLLRSPEDFDILFRNNATKGYFKLLYNIDFTDYTYPTPEEGFLPIASGRIRLDGAGRCIKGLRINRPTLDSVGIFQELQAGSYITNLGIIDIEVIGKDYVGGLAGKAIGELSNVAYIQKCFIQQGTIRGSNHIGGMFGSLNILSSTDDCYSNISVVLDGTVNGAVAGGFVASISGSYGSGSMPAYASRCYSAGPVLEAISTGTAILGGFAGSSGNVNWSNIYYDTQTSGVLPSAIGTGKMTFAMLTQATYETYDFTSIWQINEGVSYPTLRVFGE